MIKAKRTIHVRKVNQASITRLEALGYRVVVVV